MSKPVFYASPDEARSAVSRALRGNTKSKADAVVVTATPMPITQHIVDDARKKLDKLFRALQAED